MSTSPITRLVTMRNKQGMHARPAFSLAKLAQQFKARVELVRDDRRVSATSVIELLTLGAAQGTQLTLEAEGEDAQEAVNALADLIEIGFLAEDSGEQES